jgi:hypothetical protein
MHRYRIVAQISLILSILNLVLATPIVVQDIHEARGDEMVAADDMTMPKDSELEATLDRLTSPHPSPDAMASPQHSSLSDRPTSPSPSPDAMASPQYLSLSDRPTSQSPSPDTMAFQQHSSLSDRLTSPPSSPDVMTSPQHSSLSDGSTSSGYSSPYLSSDSSVSGYS